MKQFVQSIDSPYCKTGEFWERMGGIALTNIMLTISTNNMFKNTMYSAKEQLRNSIQYLVIKDGKELSIQFSSRKMFSDGINGPDSLFNVIDIFLELQRNKNYYDKKIVKKHPILMLLVTLLTASTNALETVANLILIFAINAIVARKVTLFIILLSTMILGYLIHWITGYYTNILEEKLIQRENHDIRKKYIENQMSRALKTKLDPDNIINVVTNDILLFNQQYLKGFYKLFNCIFGIIFASIALISLHWSLFLLSIILTVLLMLLPKLVGKSLRTTTSNISNSNDELLKKLNDWTKGYSDLLWNNSLSQLWNQTRDSFHTLEDSYVDQRKAQQTAIQFGAFMNIAAQAIIIALAGYLAIKNIVSIGVVMSAGNLAFQLFGAVSVSTDSIILLQSGSSINDKLVSLTKNISVDSSEKYSDTLTNIKSIELHDLSYTYKNGTEIKYPNITVNKGDKVLITGPSGSGKATQINLLNGRLSNYNGSIKLNNIEYSLFNNISFLNIFSLQPQNYHIFNDTISKNITLYNDNYNSEQIDLAIKKAQLSEKVASLPEGINTQIGSENEVFSGGELQRISLARFFIRKRPILIVDEETSALDKNNAYKVMNLLTQDKNLTLFVITHSIDNDVLDMFNKHISLSQQ